MSRMSLMPFRLALPFGFAVGLAVSLAGCSPKVGSDAWCEAMQDKPKGDWSANEAADYAKHCVFRNDDD